MCMVASHVHEVPSMLSICLDTGFDTGGTFGTFWWCEPSQQGNTHCIYVGVETFTMLLLVLIVCL